MYYVVIDDVVCGPYPVEELGTMLEEGKILPITMAVEEGHENWMSLEKLIHIEKVTPPVTVESAPAEAPAAAHHHHDHAHECPFCGSKHVKSASKEFTGVVKLFPPKTCRDCDAIWRPKVKLESALSIFLVALSITAALLFVTGPDLASAIGLRPARTEPVKPADIALWVVAGLLVLISLVAAGKSAHFLGSPKVRAPRIVRQPHRH